MKWTYFGLFIFFSCFIESGLSLAGDLKGVPDLRGERIKSLENLHWENFGPGMSGYCESCWTHPTDSSVLFLGPDMHISYGSWNGGKSWQSIKDCDGNDFDMYRLRSMDFSKQNENFGLTLQLEGGVFATLDKGKSWQKISDIGARCNVIAAHSTDDNIWFIGAGFASGIKEHIRTKECPGGIPVTRESMNVYKSSTYGFIAKSTDRGKTWRKITEGLPSDIDVLKIFTNRKSPNNLLASTNHGLYGSNDTGESWFKMTPKGLPNNLPKDMVEYFDGKIWTLFLLEQTCYEINSDGGVLWKGGVFKSTDAGKTWSDITGNLPINLSKISYSAVSNISPFYAKTMSRWFGAEAKKLNKKKYPDSIISVFNRIAVNPKNPMCLMISQNNKHETGFPPGDVWSTKDGGKTWIVCSRYGKYWSDIAGTKDNEYWKERGNPTSVNMKFAHLRKELDRHSEYQGNRFLSAASNGDIYICIDQQVLKSYNCGNSWQQIDDEEISDGLYVGRGDSNLPGRFILTETGKPNRFLLCSGEHGLWELDAPYDKKLAVKQIQGQVNKGDSLSISYVTVNPKNPEEITTLSWRQNNIGYVRRSEDGGKSWRNISHIIKDNASLPNSLRLDYKSAKYNTCQYSLITDWKNPNNMYFSVISKPFKEVGGGINVKFGNNGVYKSSDGGLTWRICNSGLPKGCSVNSLVFDPNNSKKIYAILNAARNVKGGVYLSSDEAESWNKIDIPLEIISANSLSIQRMTGDMYLSAGQKNGDWANGGVWKSTDGGIRWVKIFEMPNIWDCQVSQVDPRIVILSSSMFVNKDGYAQNNPGVYISQDGGKKWGKYNLGLAQPGKVVNVFPDPQKSDVFWCSAWGSGWYRGIYKK